MSNNVDDFIMIDDEKGNEGEKEGEQGIEIDPLEESHEKKTPEKEKKRKEIRDVSQATAYLNSILSAVRKTPPPAITKKKTAHKPSQKAVPKKKSTVVQKTPTMPLVQSVLRPRLEHLPFFKIDSPVFDYHRNEEDKLKHMEVLNQIIGWINYRLIDRQFNKLLAGLYLWSYGFSVGKTMLCNVLSKVFTIYWWVFEDSEWQQDWKNNHRYDCIVYNALNTTLLRFRQIESHGDRKEIPVTKRNQKFCDHIAADTPFITTSNKPPEKLGYEYKECNTEVWKARQLTVCCDDCPLFPLIDLIIELWNIKMPKEDALPAWYKHAEI